MARVCSVEGCGKAHEAEGFCKAHWMRWRRHGDPLAGGETRAGKIALSATEASFLLEAALAGKVGDECVTWPFRTDGKGYAITRICGRTHYVHKIVCTLTHGTIPSSIHQVAHGCGKGHLGCIAPAHLRWATPKENQSDSVIHGTKNRGERTGNNKLTETDALEIFALKGRELSSVLALRYGVSTGQILRIFNQTGWAWLTKSSPSRRAPPEAESPLTVSGTPSMQEPQ